jgi:hypothetical protein
MKASRSKKLRGTPEDRSSDPGVCVETVRHVNSVRQSLETGLCGHTVGVHVNVFVVQIAKISKVRLLEFDLKAADGCLIHA